MPVFDLNVSYDGVGGLAEQKEYESKNGFLTPPASFSQSDLQVPGSHSAIPFRRSVVAHCEDSDSWSVVDGNQSPSPIDLNFPPPEE
ncbi:hypothetical protein L2E82_31184 [Cichorium intybus]|uniref:Uncharacterized protein n=1 Tax=Cichorium intybus TaxID=13427 RepID=A0ACB9D2N1_CICIN|nr:hypothetical protein L2E82_31184 [Cichorium intybus]